MTGWLAASGIAVVLLASLYAGLANSSAGGGEPPAARVPLATSTPTADESRPAGDPTPTQDQPSGGIQGQTPAQPEGQTPAQPQPEQGGITTPVAAAEIRQGPTTDVLNRLDCQKIRGTQYQSPDERTWYLSNCVRR